MRAEYYIKSCYFAGLDLVKVLGFIAVILQLENGRWLVSEWAIRKVKFFEHGILEYLEGMVIAHK